MRKSADAFRTISEVAQDLDLPQHVLRFWETRFTQIKPMKRGGGRRYYRPDDVELLRGIRHLLYDEGYTIKGVQRILKEQGIRHVIDTLGDDGTPDGPFVSAGTMDGSAGANTPSASVPREPNELEVDLPPLVTPQMQPAQPARPIESTLPAPVRQPVALQTSPRQDIAQDVPVVNQAPHAQTPQSVNRVDTTPTVQQGQPNQPVHPTAAYVATPAPVAVPIHPDAVAHQPATNPQSPPMANMQTFMHPVNQEAVALNAGIAPEAVVAPAALPAHFVAAPQPSHAVHAPEQFPASNIAPAMVPEEHELGQKIPNDLVRGDPKFLHGESASISVADGRAQMLEEEQKSGFFTRLRHRVEPTDQDGNRAAKGMARDDVRRLQSTLFELLECKRILDQARSD